MKPTDPLGVFDSGLGGLTVVSAIHARLPHERVVYLGDTARVPYGTRSAETVIRYARGCSGLLMARGVKAIVVACNTVSAVALDMLRAELDVPILGVILPGARAAVSVRSSGAIGVLGTTGTIASGAYDRAVTSLSSRVHVQGQAAPLMVSLAEEGWVEGEVPRLVVRRYLGPLIEAGARCIVLGCTHFPLLRGEVEREAAALAGEPVQIVDSAQATAEELAAFLEERALLAPAQAEPSGSSSAASAASGELWLDILATDQPRSFADVAARFLGEAVGDVTLVDIPPAPG